MHLQYSGQECYWQPLAREVPCGYTTELSCSAHSNSLNGTVLPCKKAFVSLRQDMKALCMRRGAQAARASPSITACCQTTQQLASKAVQKRRKVIELHHDDDSASRGASFGDGGSHSLAPRRAPAAVQVQILRYIPGQMCYEGVSPLQAHVPLQAAHSSPVVATSRGRAPRVLQPLPTNLTCSRPP